MKKIIMIVIILLAVLALYVVFNLFDAKDPKLVVIDAAGQSMTLPDRLTDLFKTASFEKSNGFYRLWSLIEAPDVDIESDEVINKYRRMQDPQFDNEKYIKEWNDNRNAWKSDKNGVKRGAYTPYFTEWKKILGEDYGWMDYPKQVMEDWCGMVKEKKQMILQLKSVYGVLMARYQKLLNCEQFEEFTKIEKDGSIYVDAPLPNLLAWLHVAKLHVVSNMMDAVEGNWAQGTANLLAQINLGKKCVKSSRTLIVNLVGKAVAKMSLYGLVSIMNQKDCPKEVFQQVLNGLPPIDQDEYGNSKQLMGESFLSIQEELKNKGGLFFQVNRTKQYYYDYFAKLYMADIIPPYKWKESPLENNDVKTGLFWWIRNPSGKVAFQKFLKTETGKNLFAASFKGCAVKAVYDMTRISAELHIHYIPRKPAQEVLNGLNLYQTLLDTCSGKPYIWKDEKQFLYSIGFDKKDNGGGESSRYTQIEGVDYTIPVILY